MPKYSRYTKHSSGNDFLDLLNDTPSYSQSNNLFENTSTPGSNTSGEWNFDFTFDIKKFLYWFVLFVIGYIVQPLVVYNILPTKIRNAKEGKKENGDAWTESDFTADSSDSTTRKKLAEEANAEAAINANKRIIGSKITSLFVISIFAFVFGNWTNNINFENKINIALMTVGALGATFGLEMLKSAGNITAWIDKLEKTLKPINTEYPGFTFKPFKDVGAVSTLISIILIVFIIPLGYGIYKSLKGGFILYYIALTIITLGIFVVLPLWVKNRISLTPWIRGLAIVTLILCRFNDKFSFFFAGIAIGVICSESHWMKIPDCMKVTTTVVKDGTSLETTSGLTIGADVDAKILTLNVTNLQQEDEVTITMQKDDGTDIDGLTNAKYIIPTTHANGQAQDFKIDLGRPINLLEYPTTKYQAIVTVKNKGREAGEPSEAIILDTLIDPKTGIFTPQTFNKQFEIEGKPEDNTYKVTFGDDGTKISTITKIKVMVYNKANDFSYLTNNYFTAQFGAATNPVTDPNTYNLTVDNNKKSFVINLSAEIKDGNGKYVVNNDLALRKMENIEDLGIAIAFSNGSLAYSNWLPVQSKVTNAEGELENGTISHTVEPDTTPPTEVIVITEPEAPDQESLKVTVKGVENGMQLGYAVIQKQEQGDPLESVQLKHKGLVVSGAQNGEYSFNIDLRPAKGQQDVDGDYTDPETGNDALWNRSAELTVKVQSKKMDEVHYNWSTEIEGNISQDTLEAGIETATISGHAENNLKTPLLTPVLISNATVFRGMKITEQGELQEADDDAKKTSNLFEVSFKTKKGHTNSNDKEFEEILPKQFHLIVYNSESATNLTKDYVFSDIYELPKEANGVVTNLWSLAQPSNKLPKTDGIPTKIDCAFARVDGGDVTVENADHMEWKLYFTLPAETESIAKLNAMVAIQFPDRDDNGYTTGELNWSSWTLLTNTDTPANAEAQHVKLDEGFSNVGPTDYYRNIGSSTDYFGNYAPF